MSAVESVIVARDLRFRISTLTVAHLVPSAHAVERFTHLGTRCGLSIDRNDATEATSRWPLCATCAKALRAQGGAA